MLHQSKAQNSKDWETCEKLQKEMNTLRRELHKLQLELQLLQRKEKKAKWYNDTKKFDDGEESTNGQGRKQRSVLKACIKKRLMKKVQQ